MSLEFNKLAGKNLLVVESDDNVFKKALSNFIIARTGAKVTYSYNVPRDVPRLLLVDGIQACLIHSPSLSEDVETIKMINQFKIPMVILTSAAYQERDAHPKVLIEEMDSYTTKISRNGLL